MITEYQPIDIRDSDPLWELMLNVMLRQIRSGIGYKLINGVLPVLECCELLCGECN